MTSYDTKATQDDLQSHFDVYASHVRHSFSSFEEQYVRPLFNACVAMAKVRPVLATFVGIFVLLSLLPALAFIGFSLFTLASLAFLALLGFLIFASVALATYTSIFLTTLTILLFTSLFLTFCAVSAYFAVRLAVHVRLEGVRPGVGAWVHEVRERLLVSKRGEALTMERVAVQKAGEDDDGGSDGSGEVIKSEEVVDGPGVPSS
ncbi:hypothetical protein OE88DRAFT_1657057 [Heliocybe sulcata]|uniref:Uncharacterized protein n=1 Tax=Heliocybe sulcata TaxID=5364 RepID=A0A5C3N9P0_9AGAM|nr:hypothetical protein OE88DRAFT_1657057 [Heliocybe sulcata]